MPSMLTHRMLGDEVIKELGKDSKVKKAIDHAFELYSIGTSGPDIFFFYAAWPWANPKKAYEVAKFGSWMHEGKTDLLFREMLTQCYNSGSELQLSYTAGVILHWCLDHIAHPYVFNKTGHGKKSDIPHRYFESQLDKGMIDWKGVDLHKFKPYSVVAYQSSTWYPIWVLYSEVLKQGWQAELKQKDIQKAVKDFYKVEKVLYDPNGKKMKVVGKLEKQLHIEGAGTSMIIPTHLDPAWDVMNDDHQLWHHPSTNQEHHESFQELFEQARLCGIEILASVDQYLSGQKDINTVMEKINGNFHTGLNVPDDMKFFDLVPTQKPNNL